MDESSQTGQPGGTPTQPGWVSAPSVPPTVPPSTPPPVGSTFPPPQYAQATPPSSSMPMQPTTPPRQSRAKKERGGIWGVVVVTGIACALIAALVAGGLVYALKGSSSNASGPSPNSTIAGTKNAGGSASINRPGDIQAILAKEEPAVVAIRTGAAASTGSIEDGGGAGTGFVITPDGYIVTNNHVVEGANGKIVAAFTDGKVRSATVIGTDPSTDLAVIKVDATNLPVSTLGSSEALRVGDDVVAIGNALALDGGLSVTRGIVSAKGRQIKEENGAALSDLIQTDAAINPGNSGGPLVNSNGDVVGINTAVANPQLAQNIGFAISIDSAKPIIEQLKSGKDRRPAYLGVRTLTLTRAIAAQLGTSLTSGAVIQNVTVDGPAEKSGLKRSDIITKVNSTSIKSAEDLTGTITKMQPGDKATITYERDGKQRTVEVTLVARPS